MTKSRTLMCRLRDDVAQRPGLLWRVGHMFAERAINIDEIAVHQANEDSVTKGTEMVVCFSANDQQLTQIMRRFERFEGVMDLTLNESGCLAVKCS